jgi:hypothetical protein
VSLVIDKGNPWWESPNLWVVPNTDPGEVYPGALNPEAGQMYYATANVRSTAAAGTGVENGRLYFYWANPSLAITTTNANLIGSIPVTVPAGQTVKFTDNNDAWTPQPLPGGSLHECLVAAVVEGTANPPATLDGQNDPTVAQHNLDLMAMSPHLQGHFAYGFEVFNGDGENEQTFEIVVQPAPLKQAEWLARVPGGINILEHEGRLQHFGIATTGRPEPRECEKASPVENVTLPSHRTSRSRRIAGNGAAWSARYPRAQHCCTSRSAWTIAWSAA